MSLRQGPMKNDPWKIQLSYETATGISTKSKQLSVARKQLENRRQTLTHLIEYRHQSSYLDSIHCSPTFSSRTQNNPGTAQVGAISKAQKCQKDFKVSKYSLLKHPKNPKVVPDWRARGTLWHFSSLLWQIIKKMKSLTIPKKTERGTFWYFSTSILPQNSRKNEGGTFAEIFFV